MFIEEIVNCLADVFHSVYENAIRNSNIEDTMLHKKGVVTVTFLLSWGIFRHPALAPKHQTPTELWDSWVTVPVPEGTCSHVPEGKHANQLPGNHSKKKISLDSVSPSFKYSPAGLIKYPCDSIVISQWTWLTFKCLTHTFEQEQLALEWGSNNYVFPSA